jgi:hypothetical protein
VKPPKWCVKDHPHRGRHTDRPARSSKPHAAPHTPAEHVKPPPGPAPQAPEPEPEAQAEEWSEEHVRELVRAEVRAQRRLLLSDVAFTVLDGPVTFDVHDGRRVQALVAGQDVAQLLYVKHRAGDRVRVVLIPEFKPQEEKPHANEASQ